MEEIPMKNRYCRCGHKETNHVIGYKDKTKEKYGCNVCECKIYREKNYELEIKVKR
jgi:hypothetical protein